jgi:hypothetical protein
LISLKAGGTGLNLTAADHVIHLDPWWNPAVEDQATDRAHRIGQSRPVTVIRLIAQGTIEEAVLALHAEKRDLAERLLEGTDVVGRLSADELVELVRRSTMSAIPVEAATRMSERLARSPRKKGRSSSLPTPTTAAAAPPRPVSCNGAARAGAAVDPLAPCIAMLAPIVPPHVRLGQTDPTIGVADRSGPPSCAPIA